MSGRGWHWAYMWLGVLYVAAALVVVRAYGWLDERLKREGL